MVDFKQMIKDNEQVIVKKLQELIQIPSVLDQYDPCSKTPFGKNIDDALNYMLNLAREDGFEVLNDEGFAGEISYGNKEGKLVGVLCHLDVVPEGKGWTYPPYSGQVVDGVMYGRGTQDDKGPTLAAYFALKFIKDANIKLKNEVKIILGTDEETGWRGIKHYLEHHKLPDVAFAPDADFPLIYGEKGRMSYDLSLATPYEDNLIEVYGGDRYNVVLEEVNASYKGDITEQFKSYAIKHQLGYHCEYHDGVSSLFLKGKAAHAMEPYKGINAGTYMCDFLKDYTNNPLVKYVSKYHHLSHYCEALGLDYNDYEMGPITCNIGILNINKDNSRVTLDLRYPVRYDTDKFINTLEKITSELGVKIVDKTNKTPHYVPKESDLVQKLYRAYVDNTNDFEHQPVTIGGGTYASILPTAVAFGMKLPHEEELCHQTDERLSLETLFTGILIYIDAILALGEVDA